MQIDFHRVHELVQNRIITVDQGCGLFWAMFVAHGQPLDNPLSIQSEYWDHIRDALQKPFQPKVKPQNFIDRLFSPEQLIELEKIGISKQYTQENHDEFLGKSNAQYFIKFEISDSHMIELDNLAKILELTNLTPEEMSEFREFTESLNHQSVKIVEDYQAEILQELEEISSEDKRHDSRRKLKIIQHILDRKHSELADVIAALSDFSNSEMVLDVPKSTIDDILTNLELGSMTYDQALRTLIQLRL